MSEAKIPKGYKQTEVGVIPDEWNVQRLESLISTGPKNGYSGRSAKDAHGTPTLSLGATSTGMMILNENTVKNLEETIETNSGLYLHYGDVLVQRSNTLDLVGTTAIFDGPSNVYVYPDLMMRMHFCNEVTSHLFWRYSNSFLGRQFFKSIAAGSSGSMPKINSKKLLKMLLPLPPFPEQRAIAEALSDVDNLLSSLDKLIEKKRAIKQGAMQELLTGRKRLPGFSGKWEKKKLGEIAFMQSGGTPSSENKTYYDGDIPWVSIADITTSGKFIFQTDRNITELGLRNSPAQIFPPNTILYAMYASIGECSIACVDTSTSQAILGIRTLPGLSYLFLYFYLYSIKEKAKKLGQQGTQANLNKEIVQNFDIFLPPLPEQTAIAAILSDMDADIEALDKRRDKTKAIKQGMMQELLTGKIRLV